MPRKAESPLDSALPSKSRRVGNDDADDGATPARSSAATAAVTNGAAASSSKWTTSSPAKHTGALWDPNPSDPTPPAKRGPGRPRKSDAAQPVAADAPPTVKRGRGRPRKSEETRTDDDDGPPIKRGRGRPRKVDVEWLEEYKAAKAEGRPLPPRPTNVVVEIPARKRGRPRKSDVEYAAMCAKAAAAGLPTPERPVPEPPTPKKRGRPRKSDLEARAAEAAAAAAAAEAEGGPVAGPSKHAAPAPKKVVKAPVVPAPNAVKKASAQGPAASEAKRGPGRPRKSDPPRPPPGETTPKRGPGRPPKQVLPIMSDTDGEGVAASTPTPKRGPAAGRPPPKDAAGKSAVNPSFERVAGNLAKVANTPTPKKRGAGAVAKPRKSDLPSFDDDVFGAGSPQEEVVEDVSHEEFRANERMRRQREARNFTFDGDADAPRQTRSGRVVATKDVDEYGTVVEETDESASEVDQLQDDVAESEGMDVDDDLDPRADGALARAAVERQVTPESDSGAIDPLPGCARPHVLRVLATLTGTEKEPAPFVDEESNESLQGLVGLLRGTVERGEGNSALVTGPRGVGKTRTVERALRLLPSTPGAAPIIVRLSGHAQTDDRRAIREMGRQIALAEGKDVDDDEEDAAAAAADVDYAPTTLPSHLLALLTAPSPRAIIVIIDEFDLFTEHARQALLYCLLDVVQSVQTGPVETTPRGVAVVGVTSRVDTLLLLEKRVKSRFSHRVWRITSPLAPGGPTWKETLRRALIPWGASTDAAGNIRGSANSANAEVEQWQDDWVFAVNMLLDHAKVSASLARLSELTTDVRLLYRPFVKPITAVLNDTLDFMSVPVVAASVAAQLELAGWGTGAPGVSKLRGLPQPALTVLIVAKHLTYAGRTDFSLAQVEDEYLRFARTRLVGSGRARWPLEMLRRGFDHCCALGLLAPAAPVGAAPPRFAKVRSSLSPYEVVAFFRGEGANTLGPELVGWGKMSGGHA